MSISRSRDASQARTGGPTNSVGWLAVPLAICLLLGGATAWHSMFQSLWIDELHTAWASSGTWEQVAPRAAIGNQSPVYFGWQWWLSRTFGQSEVGLRITSWIAWLGSVSVFALILSRVVRCTGHRGLWWLVCLVALDRQQIFFATEARPYMVMSLAVLVGWLMLDLCMTTQVLSLRAIWAWLGWVACCAIAIWLQPTAAVFVAAQFAFATWRSGTRMSLQFSILFALAILIGAAWPLRYVLEPAWQGRQAWAAFAADLSWQNVLRQLPLLVVAVPGAIAACIRWKWPARAIGSTEDRDGKQPAAVTAGLSQGMYLIAWAVPFGMVFLVTALGVAPLMHARYLFAATLPLTLWTATALARLSSGQLVTALAMGMVMLQSVQQGSVSSWLTGRLPVVERGEHWREAIDYINRQAATDQPVQIFCASSLIEGGRTDYWDGDELKAEYLSLPVRSIYQVSHRQMIVPLLNDPRGWLAAISSREQLGGSRWLLLRASKAGLAKRLQLSPLQAIEQLDFGQVQLVRF